MATDTATADAALPSTRPQTPLLAGFNRLNLLRQAGLLLGLSASIALGFAVVLWSQREPMQPLYPSMQGYSVNELIEVLDANQQRYELDPASGVVLVPSDSVHNIRLQVAGAGITRDEGFGFEYLSEEPSLGTSQFLETTRYRRSLEGELQRTISSLRYVQSARVHLATPERSVFLRDNRQATASVFLTLSTGRRLSDVQVQAIANLVASSVPDMSPEGVTVVDQNGNLLSNRSQNSELGIASEVDAVGHQLYAAEYNVLDEVGDGADADIGYTLKDSIPFIGGSRFDLGGYYSNYESGDNLTGVQIGFWLPLTKNAELRAADSYDNIFHNSATISLELHFGDIFSRANI